MDDDYLNFLNGLLTTCNGLKNALKQLSSSCNDENDKNISHVKTQTFNYDLLSF